MFYARLEIHQSYHSWLYRAVPAMLKKKKTNKTNICLKKQTINVPNVITGSKARKRFLSKTHIHYFTQHE